MFTYFNANIKYALSILFAHVVDASRANYVYYYIYYVCDFIIINQQHRSEQCLSADPYIIKYGAQFIFISSVLTYLL